MVHTSLADDLILLHVKNLLGYCNDSFYMGVSMTIFKTLFIDSQLPNLSKIRHIKNP